jgi:hypothetical protein
MNEFACFGIFLVERIFKVCENLLRKHLAVDEGVVNQTEKKLNNI